MKEEVTREKRFPLNPQKTSRNNADDLKKKKSGKLSI